MSKSKTPKLDAAALACMAQLAPARAVCERMGAAAFAAKLCDKTGLPMSPKRVQQVREWLSEDAETFTHPRAGIVKLMLEIK